MTCQEAWNSQWRFWAARDGYMERLRATENNSELNLNKNNNLAMYSNVISTHYLSLTCVVNMCFMNKSMKEMPFFCTTYAPPCRHFRFPF